MFSERRLARKFRILLCALVAGAGLNSCNFHFRELPETESAMRLGADSGCLNNSAEVLSSYFQGTGSQSELSGFWNCLDKSLLTFSERTQFSEPGIYKSKELREFLEKYFLTRNKRISDTLMNELMELKRTLLGGTLTTITEEEITRTRNFFQVLSVQMTALRNFMPLTPEWAARQDASTVAAAATALDEAARAVGQTLQRTGYAYHFSHLNELRKAIEELSGTMDSSPIGRGIQDRMPLIRALKAMLISAPGDRVEGNEWVTFLSSAAKWYGIVLRSAHLKKNDEDFFRGSGRERAVSLIQDVLVLLDEAAARHLGGVIPFTEVDQLLGALQPEELLLPGTGSAATAKNRLILGRAARAFVRRILGGSDFGLTGREAEGLGHAAIRRASHLVEKWSEGQRFLELLYQRLDDLPGNGDAGPLGYFREELLQFDDTEIVPIEDRRPTTLEAIRQIRRMIMREDPYFVADENEISISAAAPLRQFSFHNLSIMFAIHEAVDVLTAGYAESREDAVSLRGLTSDELFLIFKDIEQLGYAFKLFDPNRDNDLMIKTRFREGSLFTQASRGDTYLDREEGAQLLALMLSSMRLANRIHEKIVEICGRENLTGSKDVFDKLTVEIGCYRRALFGNLDTLLKRLPEMAHAYGTMSERQKQRFRKATETVARLPGSDPEWANSNDSLGYAGLFQYIESVFRRFDTRHPLGTLDYAESRDAFPVFAANIDAVIRAKGLANAIKPGNYEALFTYMLAHGSPPKMSIGGIISWESWLSRRKLGLGWKFAADRSKMAQIFAELAK